MANKQVTIARIEAFQTSDGKVWTDLKLAEDHEHSILARKLLKLLVKDTDHGHNDDDLIDWLLEHRNRLVEILQ